MGVVNNLIDILKLKDRVTKLEKGGGGGYELPTAGMNTKGGVKVNPMYGFTMDGEYLSMGIGGKQGTIGGVVPEVKQSGDTQPVRVDTNTGKLWTAPGGGSGGKSPVIANYRMTPIEDRTYPFTLKRKATMEENVIDFQVLLVGDWEYHTFSDRFAAIPLRYQPIILELPEVTSDLSEIARKLFKFDLNMVSDSIEPPSKFYSQSFFTYADMINTNFMTIHGRIPIELIVNPSEVYMEIFDPIWTVSENIRGCGRIYIENFRDVTN